MAQAISLPYAGSPIPTDNSREHPKTEEDNLTPTLTDITDPLADQAANATDTHTHKDHQSKKALPLQALQSRQHSHQHTGTDAQRKHQSHI